MNTVILYDPDRRTWQHFSQPRRVVLADRLDAVLPALVEVEDQVNQLGLYAAGFLSYEAGPAFDSALQAHTLADFPLLWFGLYDAPRESPDLPAFGPAPLPRLAWRPQTSRAAYTKAIRAIKRHIALGNTYQVNYTIRLQAPFTGDSAPLFVQMACAQGAASGAGYSAYIDGGNFAVCSASPELFFRLEGNTLTSRPMKGTTARGLTLAEDRERSAWLAHSEKNRAENVMIVDMLRNDMGRVAQFGSVQVPALFTTERYPTVWQMTSTVRSTTAASLVDIFGALFPCASITGAPKPGTMRIIKSLETTPRGIYTGCIGSIAPGRKALFNVAIRTALVDRRAGQATYGVGGGIVWDSTAGDEYNECLLKASLLQTTLPPFDLLESLAWQPGSAENDGFFLLDRHIQRLADSAEYFNYPLDVALVRQALARTAEKLPALPHKVRLLVGASGQVTVEAAPIQVSGTPVGLGLAPSPVNPADPFLYHKTTCRQVYEQALAACPGFDDVILWNPAGEVTETAMSNLLVRLDGIWCTPPVSCGLLAGTLRAELIANGGVEERVLTLADLRRAQEIQVINSVRGRRSAACPALRPEHEERTHES